MPVVSRLARLQQLLVAGLFLLAFLWLMGWWSTRPVLACAGAVVIVLVHAIVLAVEFVLLRVASGADPAPKPAWGQVTAAWWREVVQDIVVFGWRQPFAWRAEPDRLDGARGRTGFVFVHGFVCNRGFWTPWLRQARVLGHSFAAVNLEPVFGSIDHYADIVEDAVAKVAAATGKPPMLVCHSMGGLAARAWLRRYGGVSRVARVVTIGTPHQGTWLARFSRLPNGRQMRIGGDWLQELAGHAHDIPFTCWYSNCDNIVFPPSTATLPGADNQHLGGAGHVDLAFRQQVIDRTFALAHAL
ncbi:esterase/lipase family protein [Ramlibacter humi]|uniref:Alpha/beta fold hydrolase n=1 Tax=Ramlibacter humi TaxID=2530451 RepID=A0A4Z0BG17_9BURK|nr:alpha/beta fold hydrolase [Ramlibacter humi]TFY98265.1 alpha/beta fold hydrolase [Ramlibacter humi]